MPCNIPEEPEFISSLTSKMWSQGQVALPNLNIYANDQTPKCSIFQQMVIKGSKIEEKGVCEIIVKLDEYVETRSGLV